MDIIRERMEAKVDRELSKDIWVELAQKYQPLIYGVAGDFRKKLGLEETDETSVFGGDLFFTDRGQLLYYIINQENDSIEAGTILSEEEDRADYSNFKEIVGTIAGRGSETEARWTVILEKDENFDLIKNETEVLDPSHEEMQASFKMKDDRIRSLLKRINESGACFQEDLLQGPEDYETPGLIVQLEELGLITREFYIFCRENGQQISKVSTLEALDEAKTHGFKCFSCGKLISEEKISPQIKCSALGEKFSRRNYWLALYLLYVLESLGLKQEKVHYDMEKEGRIFDVFTSFFDKFLMFEVKDEPILLEDVFIFLSRVNFFKPFRAILVTTHMVPLQVRMYLKNYKDYPITLVEGLNELEPSIAESYQHKKEVFLIDLFRNFREFTHINVDRVFSEKYFPEKVIPARTEEIPIVEETVEMETIEKIEELAEVTPEKGVEPEEVVVPIKAEVEETVEFKPEEAVSGEEEIEEMAPEEAPELEEVTAAGEAEEPVSEAVPGAIEAEETVEEVKEEAIEEKLEEEVEEKAEEEKIEEVEEEIEETQEEAAVEKPEEEEEEEKIEEVEKEEEEKKEEEVEVLVGEEEGEFKMEFTEALPSEIIPTGEIPVAVDTSEEDLENLARFVLDLVAEEGIAGNENKLEQELALINEISFYSAVLIDSWGLPLISNLNVNLDTEVIAACSTQIFNSIQTILGDSGLCQAKSIHLEGTTGRLKMFRENEVILAAHEEKKIGEIEEETGSLPGEASLREAIMKKVLEDLSKTDGIKGGVISGRDGLIIESHLPDEIDVDTLGYLSGQVFLENEKYFKKVQIGKTNQVLIKTEETFYNLISIQQEAILTTCLDPQIPVEVWQGKLPQAAQMITSALS